MSAVSIKETLRKLVKSGATDGRPWAIVRFKDLWDAGLASTRADKLDEALADVLKELGIETQWEKEAPLAGYANFVSASGATIYVGRTEITDWLNAEELFKAIKPVIADH